jgi:hypothetical protein
LVAVSQCTLFVDLSAIDEHAVLALQVEGIISLLVPVEVDLHVFA